MKVSGFSFIRNAEKYDYPIVEAITSVLPLCDEFVIAVGNSEDHTTDLIDSIDSSKIRIIPTVWDDSLREGGRVLALETDKAFAEISEDADWAFYIQGDEVVHEQYHEKIYSAMQQWKDSPEVEGLLFNYRHFYGSYDFIGDAPRWYRREVRVVRKQQGIKSYRDAQGFRKFGKKLHVKQVDAWINHYGWVKPPELQQNKQKNFHKLWHDEEWMKKNIPDAQGFDYSGIDSLARFTGTHPEVMKKRIAEKNWEFDFDPSRKNLSFKSKLKYLVEKYTGWLPGEYKNYILLKQG